MTQGQATSVAGCFAAGVALVLTTAGCRPERSGSPEEAGIARPGSGSWEEVRLGTDAGFSGLHFVDPEVGWIVGGSPFVRGGIVGRTEDGGTTWRYRTGPGPGGPTASLNAVHAFDRNRACVAGDRGALLTFDGGESWQMPREGAGVGTRLFGLHFLDEREGWATGPAEVLHTVDGGLTWTRLGEKSSAGGDVGGRAIRFVDPLNGWLAGQHARLWRTRDGGGTWARVPVPLTAKSTASPPYLFGMTWVGISQGWIVGEFGTILHTTDGGSSWSLQIMGTGDAFLTAVQFVDSENGWITGFLPNKGESIVWQTNDAGTTWSEERRLEGEELRALQMIDAETGWAVGDRVRTQPQKMLRRLRHPERSSVGLFPLRIAGLVLKTD
jgi:photosystem II stability/assembly factor-like uncharacterized protein